MSDLTKHTLTINISDRIEWIDKRCGLTEIQKDYVTAQMKEAVSDAVQKANGDSKEQNKALHLRGVVPSTSESEISQEWIKAYYKARRMFGGDGRAEFNCNKKRYLVRQLG